jgi:hypothetical protein
MTIWLLGLGLLFTFTPSVSATKPGAYNDYAHSLRKKVDSVLIRSGYCSNSNDCNKKEYLLYVGSSEGLTVELYQIPNAEILKEIIDIYLLAYKENNQKINIDLVAYREAHNELMGFKKLYKKPYIQLTLQGVEQ